MLPKWEMKNTFKLLKAFFLIVREIINVDTVHFNSLYPLGLLLIPVANLLGKTTILQIHVMDGDEPTSVKKDDLVGSSFYFIQKQNIIKLTQKHRQRI